MTLTGPPYCVRLGDEEARVEVWSSYQLQFDGQHRYAWQKHPVADLRSALAALDYRPEPTLAGVSMTTNPVPRDPYVAQAVAYVRGLAGG